MVYKEEAVLVEIDRKNREEPVEEFYLGLKMRKPKTKKGKAKRATNKSPLKLLIFDGARKQIPDFVPNLRPRQVRYYL